MSILVNKNTRVLCQGITGNFGSQHANGCLEYGTQLVGGVTPGKGGTHWEARNGTKVPIFNTVSAAVKATGADATMIFVPPPFAADAAMEAADSGVKLVVVITEGIPVLDMVKVRDFINRRNAALEPGAAGIRMVGPNCPGVITPGECKIGILPGPVHLPAGQGKKRIGIVSRSGTLTYESTYQCTVRGLGQTTCVGIGGDPLAGTTFVDVIKLFNEDPETDAIIMIGEIGGSNEEIAADYVKKNVKKPMVGFIAGKAAPEGKRMGHAGAIAEGGQGRWIDKVEAMQAAGITMADSPSKIGDTLMARLGLK